MNNSDWIEQTILSFPVCEYAFGGTEEIPFSDKVREVCRKGCDQYGKNWCCPPYCGSLEDNIGKCRSYTDFCLYSTISETENLRSPYTDKKAKLEHEQVTANIRGALKEGLSDFYILSSGCMACEHCTCPDEPCRYPDRQIFSLESHGILVTELIEEMDLSPDYGEDTIAWFGMILFNEAARKESS